MAGACSRAPISYLPLRNPKTRIYNSQTRVLQLPNRRLFLFSLPLSSFVLLPVPSFGDGNGAIDKFQHGSSSSYAATMYDPLSAAEREASALVSQRVSQAVDLLEKGRELQAQGDFTAALGYFSQVTKCTYLATFCSFISNLLVILYGLGFVFRFNLYSIKVIYLSIFFLLFFIIVLHTKKGYKQITF